MSPTVPHVLLVGDVGSAQDLTGRLAARHRVSWFAPLPAIVPTRDWLYTTVQGMHRDTDAAGWVRLAVALSAREPVTGVWGVGQDLQDAAAAVARELAVPLVGGPADGARDAVAPAGTEFSAKVVRAGGTVQVVLVTQVQRAPGSGVVVTESGPYAPLPVDVLAQWCAGVLPTDFLGAVDFVLDGTRARDPLVRPWQPGDGFDALLGAGTVALDLAGAILTGQDVGRTAPPPDGIAIAGYPTTTAGTLVEIEGLAHARAGAGVVDVTQLAHAGSTVRTAQQGGGLLLRVTATSTSPEQALACASKALTGTVPVLDVVPHLAGALDRLWF